MAQLQSGDAGVVQREPKLVLELTVARLDHQELAGGREARQQVVDGERPEGDRLEESHGAPLSAQLLHRGLRHARRRVAGDDDRARVFEPEALRTLLGGLHRPVLRAEVQVVLLETTQSWWMLE